MNTGFYNIVKGQKFLAWQEAQAFYSPGGETKVTSWEYSERFLAKAIFETNGALKKKVHPNWEKAQKAEAKFWKGWRQNVLYSQITIEDGWADILEKTGGDIPGGKVLDIGCGPISVLNFFRSENTMPLGIDPMAEFYVREQLVEYRKGWEPIPMVSLPAEKLPFSDECMDHLIAFNVLDHVSDAPAVLKEMVRVLKPGGTVRIYLHTFPRHVKKLLFFDTPHVSHWEQTEFMKLLEDSGFQILQCREETVGKDPQKTFNLAKGFWAKMRFFPYWVAAQIVKNSYFLARKPGKQA